MAAVLRRLKAASCAALAFAVLLLAACDVKVGEKGMTVGVARENASREWSRTYSLPQHGRLELSSSNGTIDVIGSTGPQVDVHVVQESTAMTKEAAQQGLETISIQERAAADHVVIDVSPKEWSAMAGRLRIRTTVRLPPGLAVTMTARNSQLSLENVDGTFTVSVQNGPFIGRGVSGGVSVSVVNGRLTLDLAKVTAPVTLSATNGGVGLGLPADARADFEARAVNGGVTIDPQMKFEMDSLGDSRGDRGGLFGRSQLTGRLNGGGPKVSVQVTNGGVRIGLPGSADGPGRRR
jgi:hypothetical protein